MSSDIGGSKRTTRSGPTGAPAAQHPRDLQRRARGPRCDPIEGDVEYYDEIPPRLSVAAAPVRRRHRRRRRRRDSGALRPPGEGTNQSRRCGGVNDGRERVDVRVEVSERASERGHRDIGRGERKRADLRARTRSRAPTRTSSPASSAVWAKSLHIGRGTRSTVARRAPGHRGDPVGAAARPTTVALHPDGLDSGDGREPAG